MRSFIVAFILFSLSFCRPAVGQNPNIPSGAAKKVETALKDTATKILKKADPKGLTGGAKKIEASLKDSAVKALKKTEAKDLAKTEKFLQKLKKKLSFVANARAREQKRIDAIIKQYVIDANLLSGTDIKKINDSLSRIHAFRIDSLGNLIASLRAEKEELAKKLGGMQKGMDSIAATIPEPAEELEMDKLADKLVPMIREKAKEEEEKEKKEKKLKIIRSLIQHPEGVRDTMEVNDSISRTFTLRLKKKEVFGFHPYWRNVNYYRNYNFSVLSSLVYYGYELDPKTGLCKDIHGWDKQKVTDFAKNENCKVYLGVFCEGEKGIKALLANNKTQEAFVHSIIAQLHAKNADGVNLTLGSPAGGNRLRFLKFIKLLHSRLTAENANYKITLTVPVLDKNFFYDLKGLEPMVEYFIVDFTHKNVRGPIAPITGNEYSLESGLSRCFGSNVPPGKFIACLPYHGAIWDAESDRGFIDYIPYSEIAESYTNEYGFTYDNGTERTDVVFNKIDTLEQLWFDDAKTLSEKYDYILNGNLGGVGVWALGDDGFNPELWDALLDKMVVIDTTDIKEIKIVLPAHHQRTFWEKVRHELHLYKLLFQHPCDFDLVDPGEDFSRRDEMVSDDYVSYVAIGAFLLLLITGIYAVLKNRALGDDWPKRKVFLTLLIILTVLNMITVLMYYFLNPDYLGFGAGSSDSSDACEVNFLTLLKLLGIGFLLGGFSMRLLVIPLMKRKEIP